ncbi:MAG: hypothetical protein U0637_10750 [Phycisphaerales bacterium]
MPEQAIPFPTDGAQPSDLEVLKADIAALREDLIALGQHAGESAMSRMERARLRMADAAKTAQAKGQQVKDQVQEQIEEHPFASVGLAFGIGVVLGVVIARR